MGETEKQLFQLSFNRFLQVGFQGSRVTSNGGLVLLRGKAKMEIPANRSGQLAGLA